MSSFLVRRVIFSKVTGLSHNFQFCWFCAECWSFKKIPINLPYYWVIWMETDQLIYVNYVLLSFWEEKYPFSISAEKYFVQELSYWQKHQGRGYLFLFSNICPAYPVMWIFFFWLSRAHSQSGSKLPLMIMFPMILDSPENITKLD